MRLLVSGGAGFIGSHLVRRLLELGHRVICIDNLITGRKENLDDLPWDKFSFIHADITESLNIKGELDGIFHLASPASPVDFGPFSLEIMDANSRGTRNLLDMAKEKKARFLLASTSEIYGDPLVHPQQENYRGNVNTTGLRSPYDESKRFAETLTYVYRKKFGINTVIARIFNTYGPGMRRNDGRVVPNFITAALSNKPLVIHGDGKQTRSFCYVYDMIDGIIRLFHSDLNCPVNLGNPVECTILELAKTIISLSGNSSSLVFADAQEDDPRRRCPDISLARKELGWEPSVSLEEGLRRTMAWFAGAGGNIT
ncbi:MAG: SDR family oxidoreductase [Candidatus Eremiobacteraeota bacterium]|nr:SDR family oxidoreductase [Candidatus Eremiobacteraeota bacterium]